MNNTGTKYRKRMRSAHWSLGPMRAVIMSVLILSSCAGDPQSGISHAEADTSGEGLYTLPGLNHGLIQSPVNILSAESAVGQHDVVLNTVKTRAEEVVNTGHSVQLNFEPGSVITFDGKTYDFLQIHFHTPSEHQIDGVTYPMEIHAVNIRKLPDATETPEYLVVGILFKMGREDPFISEFLNRVPDVEKSQDLESNPVYLADLFDEIHGIGNEPYYHYHGSLTTPPYTESVTWVVIKRILEASPEQIQKINRIEGDNARHVQALYGRKIDSKQ